MKNVSFKILSVLIAGAVLGSCQAVGDIFEAGVYTGIIVVVLTIGAIIVLIARLRRK